MVSAVACGSCVCHCSLGAKTPAAQQGLATLPANTHTQTPSTPSPRQEPHIISDPHLGTPGGCGRKRCPKKMNVPVGPACPDRRHSLVSHGRPWPPSLSEVLPAPTLADVWLSMASPGCSWLLMASQVLGRTALPRA